MPKRGLIALILSLAALRLIVAYEPPGGSIVEAPSVDPSVAPPTDTGGSPTPTKAPPAGGGSGAFRDGTYDGPAIDYKYGTAQIQIVVEGGAIVAVNPLQLPTEKGYTKRVTEISLSAR